MKLIAQDMEKLKVKMIVNGGGHCDRALVPNLGFTVPWGNAKDFLRAMRSTWSLHVVEIHS